MTDHPCSMPCHQCIKDFKIMHPYMPQFSLSSGQMILCEHCGNKRCPHASDHRCKCTGSNDPGQKAEVGVNDYGKVTDKDPHAGLFDLSNPTHVAISTAEVQRIKLIFSVTRILLESIDAEMQSDFPQLSDEILEKAADLRRVAGGEE